MSRSSIAIVVLAIIQLGYLLTLWISAQWLPPRVASHFNSAGVPDGWTTRAPYLWTMAGLALGISAVLVGIFYSIRFFPTSMINLPQKEYWLAPERRDATCDFLFRAGVWLASMEVALFWAIHLLVVDAHNANPVRLAPYSWLLVVGFILATMIWIVALVLRFCRTATN